MIGVPGRRLLAGSLLIAGLASCDREHRTEASPADRDTVFGREAARIGVIEGDDSYMFGNVASVAMKNAYIYVADRIGSRVLAYDSSGTFIRQIGAEGSGPGEFLWPNDLAVAPNGDLYVRDIQRITVLTATRPGGVADSVARIIVVASGGSQRGRTDGDVYYHPGAYYGEPNRFFYSIVDSAGLTGDTLFVPYMPTMAFLPNAIARVGADALMLDGINRVPFEAGASWDITSDGTIVAARGDLHEIVAVSSTHDTLWTFRGEMPRAVAAAEARDSANAFRERLDSLTVPIAQVSRMSDAARSATIPDFVPAILSVHTTAGGTIWLRRWPPPGITDRTIFDVHDAEGDYLYTVVLSEDLLSDPPPFIDANRVAGVFQDPTSDVQSVVVFVLPR